MNAPQNFGGSQPGFFKALASGLGQMLTPFRTMYHPGQSSLWSWRLKRTKFDYAREVGDGLDASVVTAPIMWLQRALPEAVLCVREKRRDGSVEQLDDHELLQLVRNPNEFYGDIALWGATILSMCIDGNAYWLKVRNGAGRVVALWFVPWWMMEPKASIDGTDFISWYEYMPGTGSGRHVLQPEDVIHFRNGLNPRDMKKGLSPLQGVLREIFTDLESSNFIASLLRNLGVPGVVISPKGGAMPTPEDVSSVKSYMKSAFGGDNRGEPAVFGTSVDVSQFGFNPEQMNLRHGSDRAEERVCASLGVPAAVVGFGAGLQQTKVGATMEELRKLAWHNGVLPLGRQLIDELQRSLLPDFQRGAQRNRRLELYWDTDDVLALQEDENAQTERKLKELQAGAITLFDYRTETGREADDSHKVYLRPLSQLVEPEAQLGQARQIESASPPETEEEEEPEPGQKALPAPEGVDGRSNALLIETKHSETWLPESREAASQDDIERGDRYVTRLERAQSGLSAAFQAGLRPVFERWGDEASKVAEQVLRAAEPKSFSRSTASLLETGPAIETKIFGDDLVSQIIELLNIEGWDQQLSAQYQVQYGQIASDVAEGIRESGYGTMLPDARMREVIAQGGTRAGLVDLDEQTREALFKALAEGRAEGEGVTALANRIANMIEGGRYKDAQTRAKVIARIETKHAQNISTLENGRSNGFSRFIVYDGRLGPDRSEPSHIARNGWIVSYNDAITMTANMRPNCTLSFAPHVEL